MSLTRQNSMAAERARDAVELRGLRIIDEEDVAGGLDGGWVSVPLDDERMTLHVFSPHGGVQLHSETILADDADEERGRGRAEGLCGPLHELGEIEEEDRLHLVFGRGCRQERRRPHEQRGRPVPLELPLDAAEEACVEFRPVWGPDSRIRGAASGGGSPPRRRTPAPRQDANRNAHSARGSSATMPTSGPLLICRVSTQRSSVLRSVT